MSIIIILSAVTIAGQSLWSLLKHQGANSTPPMTVGQGISSVDRVSDSDINDCAADSSNWPDRAFNLIHSNLCESAWMNFLKSIHSAKISLLQFFSKLDRRNFYCDHPARRVSRATLVNARWKPKQTIAPWLVAFDKIINHYKFEMRKASDPNFDLTPTKIWDYLVATIHNDFAAFDTFLTSVDEEIRLHH